MQRQTVLSKNICPSYSWVHLAIPIKEVWRRFSCSAAWGLQGQVHLAVISSFGPQALTFPRTSWIFSLFFLKLIDKALTEISPHGEWKPILALKDRAFGGCFFYNESWHPHQSPTNLLIEVSSITPVMLCLCFFVVSPEHFLLFLSLSLSLSLSVFYFHLEVVEGWLHADTPAENQTSP